MSKKHYDIAIIGGSLSARIAAALLAKQGSKVLFLRNREAKAPAWFHSSIFLEKLLGVLGGRSCFVAQRPIQVISTNSRVTLSSDVPLEEELCREFGNTTGTAVVQWLESLNTLGVKLEEFLWENGGLPWPSLKATGRFKLLGLRRRINWHEIEGPVSESINHFPKSARTFLTDLLQGLASAKVSKFSYARAAMLWAQALRPENLKEPDFSQMLNKRFEQFHGAKSQLDNLEKLDYNGSKWVGGKFKSGGEFTADNFLLGDKIWIDKFSQVKSSQLPIPEPPAVFRTSDLRGQLSTLLATRIICGGELPLRMAIEDHDEELKGLIISSSRATESMVRLQLETVLPFVKYRLSQESPALETEQNEGKATRTKSLTNLPLKIEKNLYCVDRTVLLPEMGAAGAALLGWTVAENLGTKNESIKN